MYRRRPPFAGRREKPIPIPVSVETGLECPICGGKTVSKDVSQEDGWSVYFCMGGTLKVRNFEEQPLVFKSSMGDEYTPVMINFSCPFWYARFER